MFKSVCAAAMAALILAGCNTVSGLGRDIERGGEKMQGAAAEQQRDMQRR